MASQLSACPQCPQWCVLKMGTGGTGSDGGKYGNGEGFEHWMQRFHYYHKTPTSQTNIHLLSSCR
jgi:hypothetical protein